MVATVPSTFFAALAASSRPPTAWLPRRCDPGDTICDRRSQFPVAR